MTDDHWEIRRPWWLPFVLEVWERRGEGEDWRRGHYVLWRRRGVFLRRRTAEAYTEWLRKQARHA